MPAIHFEGKRLQCSDGETVLDCLLRHRCVIPYGCRAGACQSCVIECEGGPPEPRQDGQLLACQCLAQDGMQLRRPAIEQARHEAVVTDKTLLTADLMGLRLRCPIAWHAGQYLNLWLDGLEQTRSYAIASVAQLDPYLELHVQRRRGGYMSASLFDRLQVGQALQVQGPLGDFFYRAQPAASTDLFIAEGTGLGAIAGIAREAHHETGAPGYLFHLTDQTDACYSQAILAPMAKQLSTQYPQTVIAASGDAHRRYRPLEERLAPLENLRDYNIYLCGGASFVTALQRICFFQGASRNRIYSQQFLDFSNASR